MLFYQQRILASSNSRANALEQAHVALLAAQNLDSKGPEKTRRFLLTIADTYLDDRLSAEKPGELRWSPFGATAQLWRLPAELDYMNDYNTRTEQSLREARKNLNGLGE